MELTFFRHGIAVDRVDPLCPVDFERPLTIDGKNKVEGAVRGLKAVGVKPDVIISSPFVRCVQTAALAARGLDMPRRGIVESDALAAGADPEALWRELAAAPREKVLVVGHGDTLEPIAGVALGLPFDDGPDGARTSSLALRLLHLKKAGALHLELPALPLEAGVVARLVWLLSPRILRQLGRS
ncbi:MAG: phosphoglycerate mutase family protein [Myxococcota bacterium]